MSLINTKIKPFKNQAFKNGEFIEITEKDTEGRWSVFFFYPADFTAQYVASHPGEVCPAKWKEGEATLAPSLDLVGKI